MKSRTIELIAPSGYPQDLSVSTRAIERLKSEGHVIVGEERILRKCYRFGGTDEERLEDLNKLGQTAEIVLAIRGGYGLSRLLSQIDYRTIAERIRQRQVVLVGHSDFTVLQLALLAWEGVVTFSGPMLNADFGRAELSQFTREHFWQTVNASQTEFSWVSGQGDVNCEAHGILWGGNLTMLCSLLGTPYFPEVQGGILFVEDVNEPPYRIERLLYQLYLSGVLRRQRALVLGSFSSYQTTEYDNGYDIAVVSEHLRSLIGIPVVSGLPFGHCPDKLTLPVGGTAVLQNRDGKAVMQVGNYPHLS